MKIVTNQQEIEYKGLYFPFNIVKGLIKAALPSEMLMPYCIHKTFNPATGQIDRKYAWETVFEDLAAAGTLAELLDDIIQREYLD